MRNEVGQKKRDKGKGQSHDIIAIGASAGGVSAIRELLGMLPKSLPAAIFIVLHRRHLPGGPDTLRQTLSKLAEFELETPKDGEPFQRGHVYLGPPDSHLVVERGLIRLEHSPTESYSRPSVDALFRSAALSYGRRVVGVLLTGLMNDGAVGLWQIRKHGGITIVQDPSEAPYADMPQNALANVAVHYCLPLRKIGQKLVALATAQSLPPPISGSRTARVLIVEDERILAVDLENRLRELGYEVAGSVLSGEDALEAVSQTLPDIVLMDIYLAGRMTGIETARMLWEQHQVPVVYLTAYTDEKTLDAAKRSAPFGYIVKPYRPEEIHVALQLAFERYEREMGERD